MKSFSGRMTTPTFWPAGRRAVPVMTLTPRPLSVPALRHAVGDRDDVREIDVRDADEVGHEGRLGVLVDVDRTADLLAEALAHDDEPVAHGERLFLVVGDVDEGDADVALQLLELQLHGLAQLGVEGAEGLVEEQHGGPVDEGARERHALLLAARELARPALHHLIHLDHLERLLHALLDLGLVAPSAA